MNRQEVETAVLKALKRVAPETDPSALDAKANLRQELEIDSYDYLSFLIGLNEELGAEIPESDYGKLTTLEAVVEYLMARLEGRVTR